MSESDEKDMNNCEPAGIQAESDSKIIATNPQRKKREAKRSNFVDDNLMPLSPASSSADTTFEPSIDML